MARAKAGGAKWGKSHMHEKPQGTVRQSQAVTTFGPGATMDLLHQAVLVGGLDFWSWEKRDGLSVIHEPRLRDSIAASFEGASLKLSVEEAFREPPASDDRAATKLTGIQVLEFPTWFVCQNPTCRALTRTDGLELQSDRYRHQCDRTKSTECVPVRFLGACRRGHIEDWPWVMLVHKERCSSPQLVLNEGPSGDFSQVIAKCTTCENWAPLSTADARQYKCSGKRPWLGEEGQEECDEPLRLLVRTATNSYFAQVVTALSVPDPARELDDAITPEWNVLKAATAENLSVFRQIPSVEKALRPYTNADVLAAVERRRGATRSVREPLRTAEFRQFVGSKAEVPGELPPEDELFFAREIEPEEPLTKGVRRIVLASKLREVRAQIGFTRIEPVTPDLQGEFDLGVQSARLGLQTDWLPATEVRGEGVFIQLDDDMLRAWEARPEVIERSQALAAGYAEHARESTHAPPFPGVRFYMLHSLSHLLISAISLECGYAASAIRERIYCSAPNDPLSMGAILLSTGTSGSEGTLGGLVDQGRQLREHLERAFDLGVLCSNDPVCAGHSPAKDLSSRWLEGSACHGCLFIAESSCERFNRYLDRALVVPTMGHPKALAYFAERP